jgi:metallo-beta-lactamase family protein
MYDFISIEFWGAAQEVTGSKHLITAPDGTKILLDCGLLQSANADKENRHFGFNPREVDVLVVSHAHIDHSGNIPNLVKQGFRGKILASAATIEVLSIMLADSARIQEDDVAYINKKRAKEGKKAIEALYSIEDVEQCLKMFHAVKMNELYTWNEMISFYFTDAGHILGSACISIELKLNNTIKRIFFSGDVGRYNDRILKAPADFPQADVILLESTYGNRLHDITEDAEQKLLNAVINTCIHKGGKLLIPAFSLGRTQEIVYALDRMRTEGKLPNVKVYVDSPLSTSATKIMRKHTQFFNEDILEYMDQDPDPFSFPNLKYTASVQDSKAINEEDGPAIIIAASGMMEAGRIKHHLTKYIEDEKNSILIVGYCEPNTIGGKLLAGNKSVRIYGRDFNVNASIEIISSYSAHADYAELIQFLNCQDPAKVKSLFLVHGTLEAQEYFADKLRDKGFPHVSIPSKGEKVNISFS